MEVTLAVLADYANISREGKLNILGVFSELNPPSLPFRLPQMFLVISIETTAAEGGREFPFQVLLWDDDGNERLSLEQTLAVPAPSQPSEGRTINQLLGLSGVRFDKVGDYAFRILISGEERRVIPLRVNEPRGGGDQNG